MDKESQVFSSHKIAVFALFLLGETGIVIPYKNGNENIFLAFLLASFLGVLLLCFSFFVLNKLNELKNYTAKKYTKKIILLLFAVYSIYLAVNTFNSFLSFLSSYILPDFSPYFLGLTLTALIIYISSVKSYAFYKFSLVTAVVSSVLLLILFLLSVPQFSLDNISLLSMPDFYDVLYKSLIYLKNAFLPALILSVFEFVYTKTKNKNCALKGYIIGVVMLTVCLLNSLLIFGNQLSSKLDFPYSEAISTVTAGNIFFRMDGFSYFVFFASCTVKICLLLKIFVKIFKEIICYKEKE